MPPVPPELGSVAVIASLAANVWRLRGADGDLVMKTGPGTGDEAEGLRRLAAAPDGPLVPAVVYSRDDVLVEEWVEPRVRGSGAEADLGRALARLHRAPVPEWGGGSSWIGACRVDPAPAEDGPAFYARRLRDLAGLCGLSAGVDRVVARLGELIPPDGPAMLHGDLWWGNVLWGHDGRPRLIDPSVHGGHPEEDLAMLALFGPVPPGLIGAYMEVRPIADGWEERVAFWQLYPLLVHTVLFGGGYRASAEAVIRRYS